LKIPVGISYVATEEHLENGLRAQSAILQASYDYVYKDVPSFSITRYVIDGIVNPENLLLELTILGPSGLKPKSLEHFKLRTYAGNTFYFSETDTSEGSANSIYYLIKGDNLYSFEVYSFVGAEATWEEDFDIEKTFGNLMLVGILSSLGF